MNISDIAKLAGVSQAAVSRYLNNGYLSEQKREAIRKVIEQTGYRPLAQAQSLRNRKSRTIGMVLPKLDSTSVNEVVEGVLEVLSAQGYQMILTDTQNSPKKELEALELLGEQRVEGVLLLASVITPRHLAMFKKLSAPLVIIGQDLPGYSCVYHDDYGALHALTSLVLAKGRRRPAMIAALPQDKAAGEQRSRGFSEALQAAGLQQMAGRSVVAKFTIQAGYEAARQLLASYPDTDALLCATDRMAVGALQYLHEAGIQVPQQVMLTGLGGSVLCQVTSPPVTTARFAYHQSGATAAHMLLEKLEDPDTPVKNIRLGFTLQEAQSTQP